MEAGGSPGLRLRGAKAALAVVSARFRSGVWLGEVVVWAIAGMDVLVSGRSAAARLLLRTGGAAARRR
uniref:Uncharacterized protein n=1 Tax=Thermogemmatispora argillosa TaxID=2045280 RepID=A0A455T5H7_9CHLR|nr:hypothetical protein KTA_35470 [Thermogemmatispora argillosa]